MTARLGVALALAGSAAVGGSAVGMAAGCTGADPADSAVVIGPEPTIASIDRVACTAPEAGERWEVALTATDPQGADTVASGHVSVLEARGNELSRYGLACAAGACTGGSRADIDGVTCASAVTFVFTVTDADGNVSAPTAHVP